MSIPAETRMEIYLRDNGICGICGKPVDISEFHVDHIKAKSLGGPDDAANLRCAHRLCNLSRGNGTGHRGILTKNTTLTISLYPEDIAALQQIARDTNIRSISATFRNVLSEYMRNHDTQVDPILVQLAEAA